MTDRRLLKLDRCWLLPFWLAGALMLLLSPKADALEKITLLTPGATEELASVLRTASVLLAAERDGVTGAQDYYSTARIEYGRLLGALYSEGYYSGVIRISIDGREAASIAPIDAPTTINRLSVTIEPGPRFAFSRIGIAPLAPGTVLPDRFGAGQVARSGVIQEAADVAIERWRMIGHAKATVTAQQITADHLLAEVDVRFGLAPGPRVRFGALMISGNEKVRTERVRAIAGLPTGAVYNPAAVDKAADRLRRTGAFKSVTLSEAEALGPGDTLAIDATLVEQLPRRLSFGAEIATLDGLTVSGSWLHRNLLGGAESLLLESTISGIGAATGGLDYGIGARFNRPATFTPDTSVFVALALDHSDDPLFISDTGSVEVGLAHVFSDQLSGELGFAYAYERAGFAFGDFNFSILSLPVSLTWDRRNDLLDATAGTYLTAEATPFVGFNDAGSGARFAVDARAYRAFGTAGRVVMAGRVQLGAVVNATVFETPTDYLFYSGGGGTVRGQPYQSLAVQSDCTGILNNKPNCVVQTGGRSFIGLSGEVRTRIGARLGLVGFADAGFIAADLFDNGSWHSGAGLGLRYDTGIGPIRLDVATPVGGDTGSGLQVYIGIGQAF